VQHNSPKQDASDNRPGKRQKQNGNNNGGGGGGYFLAQKYEGGSVISGSKSSYDEEDFLKLTIVGTCKKLERDYLRLTAPPKPEHVRPEKILGQQVKNIKTKYVGERDEVSETGR